MERTRLEDLAGFPRLGHAASARFGRLVGRPLAIVQVEQDDLVAEVGIAGDGSSAAILGVARMAAADDDLELVLRGSGTVRPGFDLRRCERWHDQAGSPQNLGLTQQVPPGD